jgi:hypothetical protein
MLIRGGTGDDGLTRAGGRQARHSSGTGKRSPGKHEVPLRRCDQPVCRLHVQFSRSPIPGDPRRAGETHPPPLRHPTRPVDRPDVRPLLYDLRHPRGCLGRPLQQSPHRRPGLRTLEPLFSGMWTRCGLRLSGGRPHGSRGGRSRRRGALLLHHLRLFPTRKARCGTGDLLSRSAIWHHARRRERRLDRRPLRLGERRFSYSAAPAWFWLRSSR